MNAYNVNRLKRLLDLSKDFEEELLPCFAEEDVRLKDLCEFDMHSNEQIRSEECVNALEGAISDIKSFRDNITFVLENMK